MDTKKLDTGSRDAISWLPDEVLCNILSLLPMKHAASTSLLSKKWRNVFRLVDSFDGSVLLLPHNDKRERGESFRNFLDRTQCDSPIKKFVLKRHIGDDCEMAYVGSWIYDVVERGVLEVDLSFKTEIEISLPCQLFTSKTLVKLTLGTQIFIGVEVLPPDMCLPALKILFINSIFFEYDMCRLLFTSCPVLEELSVRHEDYIGTPFCISNHSIKKLSVHYDAESEIDFMSGLSFDTPSLVFLDYFDYALNEYTPINLEALVEAMLDTEPALEGSM